MNEADILIKAQFDRLPKELQGALNAVPWKSLVNEISGLKTLSLEQVETIERETMFILYGFENPNDYVANMMREAQIDEPTATAIAGQVDEKILKQIAARIEKPQQEPAEEKPSVPEIIHSNLPMVEEGETVHDVPHVEQPPTSSPPPTSASAPVATKPGAQTPPTVHYPSGQDPYREPLE